MDPRFLNTNPSQGAIRAEMLVRLAARGKLLVIYQDGYAFVFAEGGGGHGGEIDLSVMRKVGEYYETIFDRDDTGLPNDGPHFHGSGGELGEGAKARYAWRLGHTHHATATVRFQGKQHQVAADDHGYWAFIREIPVDDYQLIAPEVIS